MARKNSEPVAQHPAFNPLARIVIENVYPELDGGRYPVKRITGESVAVRADIFCDGHTVLAAVVKYRRADSSSWSRTPMAFVDNDRWLGFLDLDEIGRYVFTIESWTDVFESWRDGFVKKGGAGENTALEMEEGISLIGQAVPGNAEDEETLARLTAECAARINPEARAALLLSDELRDFMGRCGPRTDVTTYFRELEIVVDRLAARTAAWYEMFPRSQGVDPNRGATFDDCIRRIPYVRDLGFDVLYFVPIHPIGDVNRKGANNAVTARPGDPGSPYAIGSADGGHDAIHSELGTMADFRRLVLAARENGMELALDFAIQCAPDHPWVREHPEWFRFRPDGTIRYAENPPKKYQDIVNFDFYNPDREGLWNALRDLVLFWVGEGVKTFRVDNPHTKPVPFWEWLIREVQTAHPDVIFLAEAFTRPKMLKALARSGFTQSYTYFTWRNFKDEFIDYLTELTQSECKEYLRPNFFTNTPDILPPILQRGGRPAFQMRFVLAATLSSVYGIYNGFELCENVALPNSEEYLDSEKYQYKAWDWNRPGNIKDYIRAVNAIRRDNPALHELLNLRFYPSSSDDVLFYGKMTRDRTNMVFIAVNLDPFEAHETEISFPLDDMNIRADDAFEAEDLFTGERHLWRGATQTIRLDPAENPAALLRVTPFRHVDYRTPCF